jgi:hypothetical protein
MRSEGFSFYFGGLVEMSAAVGNEAAMAVRMTSFAKIVTFGGFKRRVASSLMASVPVCDIATCFITCRKPFCVARAKF